MQILSVAFAAGFLFLLGVSIFQWLWNITMPELFKLKKISFWVALRLILIAGFLTSGAFFHLNWRG